MPRREARWCLLVLDRQIVVVVISFCWIALLRYAFQHTSTSRGIEPTSRCRLPQPFGLVARRYRFQLVGQTVLFVGVAHDILTQAADGAVLPPHHPILLMQLALPDHLLVQSFWRGWHLRPTRSFVAHEIICDDSPYLDRFDLLLLSDFIEFLFRSHLKFTLLFRLLKCKLLPDCLSVCLLAKIFELIFGPDLFMDALGPGLVLVVVTYH